MVEILLYNGSFLFFDRDFIGFYLIDACNFLFVIVKILTI